MDKPASLNDVFGMMGGLMSSLMPSEDAAAIKSSFDELSKVLNPSAEVAATGAVGNSHEIPTKFGNSLYEWVTLEDFKLPENALMASKDAYVGRGLLDGSLKLGKFHAKDQKLFVSHLGEEKEILENIEVLCVDKDAKVKWVDCEDGKVPTGAIVGTIVEGKTEFVGRGEASDEISPGRIVPDDNCMYIPYGGRDEVLSKCQALVIENEKPLYEWVPVDYRKEQWTPDLLERNRVRSGQNIYVTRTELHGIKRLAKYDIMWNHLFIAHCGKEEEIGHKTQPWDVLIANPGAIVEWHDCENGKVPKRAVLGSIVDGKMEFVGRVYGTPEHTEDRPGQIVPSDGCMYAPFAGKSQKFTEYQALVIR